MDNNKPIKLKEDLYNNLNIFTLVSISSFFILFKNTFDLSFIPLSNFYVFDSFGNGDEYLITLSNHDARKSVDQQSLNYNSNYDWIIDELNK